MFFVCYIFCVVILFFCHSCGLLCHVVVHYSVLLIHSCYCLDCTFLFFCPIVFIFLLSYLCYIFIVRWAIFCYWYRLILYILIIFFVIIISLYWILSLDMLVLLCQMFIAQCGNDEWGSLENLSTANIMSLCLSIICGGISNLSIVTWYCVIHVVLLSVIWDLAKYVLCYQNVLSCHRAVQYHVLVHIIN